MCGMGTGLRRCGRNFDVSLGLLLPSESSEWIRTLARYQVDAKRAGFWPAFFSGYVTRDDESHTITKTA
jgi:hypothetical protein